jgi:hypothetical protein
MCAARTWLACGRAPRPPGATGPRRVRCSMRRSRGRCGSGSTGGRPIQPSQGPPNGTQARNEHAQWSPTPRLGRRGRPGRDRTARRRARGERAGSATFFAPRDCPARPIGCSLCRQRKLETTVDAEVPSERSSCCASARRAACAPLSRRGEPDDRRDRPAARTRRGDRQGIPLRPLGR